MSMELPVNKKKKRTGVKMTDYNNYNSDRT